VVLHAPAKDVLLGHHRKRSEARGAGILHQGAVGVDLVRDELAAGCLLNSTRLAAEEGDSRRGRGGTHGRGDVEWDVTNRLTARRQDDLQTGNPLHFDGDSRASRSRSGGGWRTAGHGVDGEGVTVSWVVEGEWAAISSVVEGDC
jgi:hypothetical protein